MIKGNRQYISILLLLSSVCLKGQEEKPFGIGNILIGGSISFDGHKIIKTNATNTFEVQHSDRNFLGDLHFGIFAYDNLVVGLRLDYAVMRYKYETEFISNSNLFLIEPFGRFYTATGIFGEAIFGIGSIETGEFGFDPLDDRKIKSWSLGIGYCLIINKNVAFEPLISYEFRNEFDNTDNSGIKISGLNAQFGVQIFLNPFNKNLNP